MNKKILVALFIGLALIGYACSLKPKTSCLYGDDIPADILEQVILVGNQILNALEAGNMDEIYDRGSEFMKKSQTREQFKMILGLTKERYGEIGWTQLQED